MKTDQSTIRDNMVRYFASFSARDLNAMDQIAHEMFDDTYIFHHPNFPDATKGPDRIKKIVRNVFEKWTDVEFTIEDMFGEENKLAIRYKGKLTNSTTGDATEWWGVVIQHYAGNKVVEEWEK